MRALVIEDKNTEIRRAEDAAKKAGVDVIVLTPDYAGTIFEVVSDASGVMDSGSKVKHWLDVIELVDVVVTDLFWKFRGNDEKPNGLLVALHSAAIGKPVCICTAGREYKQGHHGAELSFIYDGYVKHDACARLAQKKKFFWNEDKNWENAFASVVSIGKK